MIAVNREVEFGRDFLFVGRAVQALLRGRYRCFDLLGALALLAGCPIETAQAVQHSPSDLVFGVGSQVDMARRIETVDGRN